MRRCGDLDLDEGEPVRLFDLLLDFDLCREVDGGGSSHVTTT